MRAHARLTDAVARVEGVRASAGAAARARLQPTRRASVDEGRSADRDDEGVMFWYLWNVMVHMAFLNEPRSG